MSLFNILRSTVGRSARALAACTMLTAPAFGADRIVVLADDYPAEVAKEIATSLGTLFGDLRSGDRLTGLSAGADGVIFDVTVPDDTLYDRHAGHRNRLLGPAWKAFGAHLKDAVANEAALGSGEPASLVDLPATLRGLGHYAARQPVVSLLGNPIDHNPLAPEFSMEKGYPNDAHFLLTPGQSPFGVQGFEQALSGVDIHLCVTGADWVNIAHRQGVERSVTLLAEAQDARMPTFSQNLTDCLGRFARNDTSGARVFQRDWTATTPLMYDVTLPAGTPSITPSAALQAAIASGKVTMHVLELYDNAQEDGDVVAIVADGFRMEVALENAPRRIEVPVTQGSLRVVGVADGTGGITVAIRTEAGVEIVSDKIGIGQEIAIPIATH